MLPAVKTPRFVWPALGSASTFRREVDDLVGRFFNEAWSARDGGTIQGWQAPLSVWDDEQSIYVEAELPGVSQDDVEIVVQNGALRLRGERRLLNEAQEYWYNERTFGRFERVITLSEMVDPDNIEARLHNGVLSIKLMKRPEAQPKRVAIKAE